MWPPDPPTTPGWQSTVSNNKLSAEQKQKHQSLKTFLLNMGAGKCLNQRKHRRTLNKGEIFPPTKLLQ